MAVYIALRLLVEFEVWQKYSKVLRDQSLKKVTMSTPSH